MPGQDRADHRRDQQDRRQQRLGGEDQLLRQRHPQLLCRYARSGGGVDDRVADDPEHEQPDHHEARQQGRRQQVADRHLGDRGVDDHHDRRRDHGAERPAGADRSRDQAARVVGLDHRRDHQQADHHLDRADHAGAGREQGTHAHGRQRQATGEPAEPDLHALEHAPADAGLFKHGAHEDEQWHRRQGVIGGHAADEAEQLQASELAEDRYREADRRNDQAERDRYPGEDQEERRREHQGGEGQAIHERLPAGLSAVRR